MRDRLGELKNKGEVQCDNPKSGLRRLRGRSLTRALDYKVEVTVQTRFQKEPVACESGHKYSVLTNIFEQTKQIGELQERFFTWVKGNAKVHKI